MIAQIAASAGIIVAIVIPAAVHTYVLDMRARGIRPFGRRS